MRALELKIPPLAAFLITGLAIWALTRLVPQAGFALPGSGVIAGLLVIAGAAVAISAIRRFRQHDTTVHPGKPGEASAVVTTGVYRYTRNPMYLGLACLLAAWAVKLGNVAALLCVPVFIAYITRYQIIPEERALQASFGDSYAQYVGRVRRWL